MRSQKRTVYMFFYMFFDCDFFYLKILNFLIPLERDSKAKSAFSCAYSRQVIFGHVLSDHKSITF